MNKNLLALPSIVLLLLGTLAVTSISGGEGIRYHSMVCVYKNGELIQCDHNVLTNNGKDLIQSYLSGGAGAAVDYIALGNGSAPTSTSTTLDNEITTSGLARAQGSVSSVGTGNWSLNHQWTSTGDNIVVNTTALFNASSGGTMFAGNEFTDVTLQKDDKINVTWWVWVT